MSHWQPSTGVLVGRAMREAALTVTGLVVTWSIIGSLIGVGMFLVVMVQPNVLLMLHG